MAIFAYGIGSGITTALVVYGLYVDFFYVETRYFKDVPFLLELFGRVFIPFWVPPFTAVDLGIFISNLGFGLLILLYWTAKYQAATSPRW